MDNDIAEEIVESLIALLCNRAGFDDWWHNIDDDIQEEIIEELEAEVDSYLQEYGIN